MFFFFFKQKTAYELRISDWSSDVCSSDLNINLSAGRLNNPNNYHYYAVTDHTEDSDGKEVAFRADVEYDVDSGWLDAIKVGARYSDRDQTVRWGAYNWANISNTWTFTQAPYFNIRSEEHTSELQSLMRISYAVFCLK